MVPPSPHLMASQSLSTEALGEGNNCFKCKSCSGFISGSNEWRNVCTNCNCNRVCHDVSAGASCCGIDRIGYEFKMMSGILNGGTNQSEKNGKCYWTSMAEAEGYKWIPQGLPSNKLSEWMHQLPAEKVPSLGSKGEIYRQNQLDHQLPKQDFSLKYCQHVSPKDQTSFLDFICARNEIALDVGHAVISGSVLSNGNHQNGSDQQGKKEGSTGQPCPKCNKLIFQGEVAVIAPLFNVNTLWHPACFTCATCDELLVDLTYYLHNGTLLCGRHHAESLKPRCGACDELIFDGEYTKAKGKDFHSDHFTCVSCNVSLTGQKYVLTDDRPCCLSCFEQNFSHTCRVCEHRIGLDSKDMSYKEFHWHEGCFKCSRCKESLVDKQFATNRNSIICSSCYDSEFSSQCDGCGETFKSDTKKMEFKSGKWHEKCFQCGVCKQQVRSKPFIIPNETDIYCVPCYEDKFSPKCAKCEKPLKNGGVTFKNETWHKECFICANCNTMLSGEKFGSKLDKNYCANCFGELFAKRCTSCKKPITGSGGTKLISFEGRHWHSPCFQCAVCQVPLAGKSFITDGEEIVCPDCARQKVAGSVSAPFVPT